MTASPGRRPRVAILGSLNTDFSMAVRALPQPGETVAGEKLDISCGGKGGNQAVAAARLGANVRFVGRVGGDIFADEALRALEMEGIDVSGIRRESMSTGSALILVDSNGENVIAVAPGANGLVETADVETFVAGLQRGDVAVLQFEIPLTTVAEALSRAHAADATTVLNASPVRGVKKSNLPAVDVLVVNAGEAGHLAGIAVSDKATALSAARRLLSRAASVVVTLGAQGALVVDGSGSTHVKSFPVEVVDSTGAGDAFVGALAYGLGCGLTVTESARLGAAAGAVATTTMGARTALPPAEDLARRFEIAG